MIEPLLPTKDLTNKKEVEKCFFTIRGMQVMFDTDLAYFFGVETKRLNQQMKRNIQRFPPDFCFQINYEELSTVLRSQNVTSNYLSSKRRYCPCAYTEVTNDKYHDRFLILDDNICYSLGTSLNYAGKRLFSIHKIEDKKIIDAILLI